MTSLEPGKKTPSTISDLRRLTTAEVIVEFFGLGLFTGEAYLKPTEVGTRCISDFHKYILS